MSRGKFTASIYIYYIFALQYTTAHLQVLFSLQLLGRITKVFAVIILNYMNYKGILFYYSL